MIVTVYGSSSARTPAAYLRVASEVGTLCAQRGWTVVNGAGKFGCMGALNDAVLAAGGTVRGVILRQFATEGLQHPSLIDVLVADDMRRRKHLLADGADAFIALPGGPGTWEELWEIAVQRQIGNCRAPLIGIDVNGCYAGFRQTLARAEQDGLLYGPASGLVTWVETAAEAVERIGQFPIAP